MTVPAIASIPYYTHTADDVRGVPAVDGVAKVAILFLNRIMQLRYAHIFAIWLGMRDLINKRTQMAHVS
jgi:hypothetical protein